MSLKDLVEERKAKLEQQYWLCQLSREVDELEHWIAEKEVVAGSPELGQDYEHVTVRSGRGDGAWKWPVGRGGCRLSLETSFSLLQQWGEGGC